MAIGNPMYHWTNLELQDVYKRQGILAILDPLADDVAQDAAEVIVTGVAQEAAAAVSYTHLYNRRHFHTNIDACIMCAYWQNIADSRKEIEIAAYDIDDNTGTLVCLLYTSMTSWSAGRATTTPRDRKRSGRASGQNCS